MVDSQSVGVGREVTAWVTDLFVVPEAGREGQHALGDSCDDAGECAGAVAFERELFLERLEDRLDPLSHPAERSKPRPLVLAVGADELPAEIGDQLLELASREAFVGQHDAPIERNALEDLGGRAPLGDVGRGEFEADRHAVRRAEQKEPEAPEIARVRAAVAVSGVAGERRAASGLARLATRDRGRVEQQQLVAEGVGIEGDRVDRARIWAAAERTRLL